MGLQVELQGGKMGQITKMRWFYLLVLALQLIPIYYLVQSGNVVCTLIVAIGMLANSKLLGYYNRQYSLIYKEKKMNQKGKMCYIYINFVVFVLQFIPIYYLIQSGNIVCVFIVSIGIVASFKLLDNYNKEYSPI